MGDTFSFPTLSAGPEELLPAEPVRGLDVDQPQDQARVRVFRTRCAAAAAGAEGEGASTSPSLPALDQSRPTSLAIETSQRRNV
jgi:hypothetical protein